MKRSWAGSATARSLWWMPEQENTDQGDVNFRRALRVAQKRPIRPRPANPELTGER
jgi:hypothetical protein